MFQITYKNQFFPISKSLEVFIQKELPKVPFETIDNATVFFVDNTFISLVECIPTSSSSHFYIMFPSKLIKKFRVNQNLISIIANINKDSNSVNKREPNLKKQYGKFFTKRAEYILKGLSIPKNVDVIEPFAGNGDLIM